MHYLSAALLSPTARKIQIHPNPKENVGLFAKLSFTRNMTFVSPKFKLVNLWQFPNAEMQICQHVCDAQISQFKCVDFPLAKVWIC